MYNLPEKESYRRRLLTGLLAAFLVIPLIVIIIVLPIYYSKHSKMSTQSSQSQMDFNYTSVIGFFLQDDPSTDDSTVNYTTSNFGLIDRTYSTDSEYDPTSNKTLWERFEYYVRQQNAAAPSNVQYKVLFLGRHGQGVHNVAEAYYGTPAWNCYWSRLDGNATVSWSDAHLTDVGVQQALAVNSFWKSALTTMKIPAPESYYTSPLWRCLMTSNYTFSDLDLPKEHHFKPVIKELLRETLGVHTCDRRHSKSEIHSGWPPYAFESGFSEKDLLWNPDYRETGDGQTTRLKKFLDDVFAHDNNTFISMTSHGGSISAMLAATGHRGFFVDTGGVIPIFVRAEKLGTPASTSPYPPTKLPVCASPPKQT